MDVENWYLVTTPVLSSMTVLVLRVIVEGILPKDSQKTGPIREAIKATAENSRNRPGIYALVLADKKWGNANGQGTFRRHRDFPCLLRHRS